MYLNRGSFNFRRTRRDRLMYVLVYVVAILAGLYLWWQVNVGVITPPGIATATSTRSPTSYSEEAEKQFSAGRLREAIAAYQEAIKRDPKRVDYWIQLARIQVYADQSEDAVETAQSAILLEPENSTAHAVHALALDWSGNYTDAGDAVVRAIQLDSNNALAHAYYAEILVDQQRWSQARDAVNRALQLDPNSMDAYRVFGYYLEATSNYEEAIEQYKAAIKINPNLGFLYMQVGVNYRILEQYDLAIQYFQRASAIDPNDIEPYRSISRTYFQIGEYGAAAQYLEEALQIDPVNALIHGDLGKIYFKSLNYENAIIELGCAIKGCSTLQDTVPDDEGAAEYPIEPLELNGATLETYYIYSSVLAAMSTTPDTIYCPEARQLFIQIRDWTQLNDPENPIVFNILDENENICQIADATATAFFLAGGKTSTPAPTDTPAPGALATLTPGPTP
jgi:tetratricopeptide (TPR) repeat protein